MPVYQPNQPQYYPDPDALRGYQMLNNVMGLNLDGREKFEEIAFRNQENLKAFACSRLAYKADKPGKLKELLNLLPGLKADPKQREARRQLSERAREVISDVATRKYFASSKFSKERELRVIMSYDTSESGVKRNEEIFNIVRNGTPEQRGKLLEDHVNNSMEMFEKIINGNLSNEYLVENFEKFFALHELASSAQVLWKTSNRSDVSLPMVVSEDVIEKLKRLEQNSNAIERTAQRVKMIANANYEHLDLEYLNTCDERSYQKFQDYMGADMDNDEEMLALGRSMTLRDAAMISSWCRGLNGLICEVQVMSAVARDFGENKEQATIKFVSDDGQIMQAPFYFAGDQKAGAVAKYFTKGGMLVTDPNGQVACYQASIHGQVTKVAAKDMLNDMAPEMKDVLGTVNRANRGLFIGSKEYSNALKAVQNLNNFMEKAPKPLAGDDEMKAQFKQAMDACKAYMDKKNPNGGSFEKIEFKNDREKLRYEAMEKAFNYCKKGMTRIDLQQEAIAAELKCALGGEGKVEVIKSADVFKKVGEEYSGLTTEKGVTSAIRESDAGNIADELRADINKRLERVLTIKNFDKDEARETFSDMVLLEIVKRGRGVDDFGRPVAGAVEKALAAKPGIVARAFRDNSYIRAVTENLDVDMLRHFVMTDRAKEVAEKMTQFAEKMYAPKEENKELQMQNEQQVQKNEPAAPIH